MNFLTLDKLNLVNKKVLVREDFNVPICDGKVANDKKLHAALPTLEKLLASNARIILMSHLGRPKEGEYDEQYSLNPVAERLSNLIGREVRLIQDWQEHKPKVAPGEIVLLENTRFLVGEKENSEELSKKLASLADIFVMDAFATSHRKQASTYGVAAFAKVACAGPLLLHEIAGISSLLDEPARPMVAVIGGSKVSTKLNELVALSKKVDALIVGGGIANTFIAAAGLSVGKSLYEDEMLAVSRDIIRALQEHNGQLPMPVDVVVASECSATAKAHVKSINNIASADMILDCGPDTIKSLYKIIKDAGTIIWNGPLGVFEYEQFANGTKVIGEAIANSSAVTIAGGGDTLAAIDKFGLSEGMTYISTGGGAFIEFVAGNKLPALEILQERAEQDNK